MSAAWFLAAAAPAWAVSWQWQSVDGRERVVIYLDAPGAAKVERTDRTAVTVTLPTPPQTVTQAPGTPNPASSLVTKVDGQGQTLTIGLKAPAFGYITTTPNPRQVQIDFFADPLGARWKPKPGAQTQTAPAPETPPAAAQTEQAAPPAPQEAQTQESAQAQTQATPQEAQAIAPPAPENAAAQTPIAAQTGQQATSENAGQTQIQPQTRTEAPSPNTVAGQRQIQQPAQTPGQAAQPQTQTQIAASGQDHAAPQTSGGLTERDITDTPPPTVLDNLFSTLMDEENKEQTQAQDGTQAQNAQARPESTPPASSPEPALPKALSADAGAETAVIPPAPQTSAADYAFVGAINPGGPEQWNPKANTLSSPRASLSSAPAEPPPAATGQNAAEALQMQGPDAAGAQISAITPPPDAAQPENQAQTPAATSPAPPTAETGDALEEVVKNPPPMLSTTGQLAEVQSSITPPIEPPLAPPEEATLEQSPAQTPGQTSEQTSEQSPEQAAAPDKLPGSTAAGEVFGEVQPHPETPAEDTHNATIAADDAENSTHEEAPPKLDEDGNPIPPPPDPEAMLAETAKLLAGREYQKALDNYNAILALPDLTNEQREAAMYGVSDAQFGLGQDNLAEHFAQIVDATERAMNFNLQSPRVPSLLMRLGFVNMKMDNLQEAEAYFNMLKRKYPNDPNIPLTYYYWGDYFFKHDDFRRSSDQFQYIVQNYPDSKYVREASLGLARSLYNLGYYEQASQVGEYIDRRWPRFYIEFPGILTMFGDTALRMNKLSDAKRYYWTYYNIAPTAADADTSLVHLGDIYMKLGKPDAAKEVYQNAMNTFPTRDGGLIAQMRLVEEGIYDAPLIPEMDALFDRGYNLQPMEVYNRIINDFPDSTLVPLATLKLAMWELWNKRYEDAIATCEKFTAKYPKHELLPNAQEVLLTAFSRLTADALPEGDYARILRAWESAPALQAMKDRLSPQVLLSLSLSEVNQNKSAEGLADLDPFFRGAKDPEFGDSALTLALSTMIDTQSWSQIEPLAMRVAMWELKPETKAQLDYARALAFENLGQPENAMPLWEELKNRNDLSPQLQAYTQYFLSRAALRNNDMENAYYLSRQALQSLSDIAEADPSKADNAKIKTLLGSLLDITESSGRAAEALEWYQQYAQYVRDTDEEWPSLRFRLAQLYKTSGDTARWASLLKELAEQYPETLYGKMAASELETHKLRQNISDFMPPAGQ